MAQADSGTALDHHGDSASKGDQLCAFAVAHSLSLLRRGLWPTSESIGDGQNWVREKLAMSGLDSPPGTESSLPGSRNIDRRRSVRR